MAVFCFGLVFMGYCEECVLSVCSAGFFFQVCFWAAISCAEHGSQNCPKLIRGLKGVLWHKASWEISETALTRVCSRIMHLFLLLSCPISPAISPGSYQHWYYDCDFDCVKRSWVIHTGLKLGLFCIWVPLLLLSTTRASLITLTCNCGCKGRCAVTSHKQGVCIWSGLIAGTAKKTLNMILQRPSQIKSQKTTGPMNLKVFFFRSSKLDQVCLNFCKDSRRNSTQRLRFWIYKMRRWLFKDGQNVIFFWHFSYNNLDFEELF